MTSCERFSLVAVATETRTLPSDTSGSRLTPTRALHLSTLWNRVTHDHVTFNYIDVINPGKPSICHNVLTCQFERKNLQNTRTKIDQRLRLHWLPLPPPRNNTNNYPIYETSRRSLFSVKVSEFGDINVSKFRYVSEFGYGEYPNFDTYPNSNLSRTDIGKESC